MAVMDSSLPSDSIHMNTTPSEASSYASKAISPSFCDPLPASPSTVASVRKQTLASLVTESNSFSKMALTEENLTTFQRQLRLDEHGLAGAAREKAGKADEIRASIRSLGIDLPQEVIARICASSDGKLPFACPLNSSSDKREEASINKDYGMEPNEDPHKALDGAVVGKSRRVNAEDIFVDHGEIPTLSALAIRSMDEMCRETAFAGAIFQEPDYI